MRCHNADRLVSFCIPFIRSMCWAAFIRSFSILRLHAGYDVSVLQMECQRFNSANLGKGRKMAKNCTFSLRLTVYMWEICSGVCIPQRLSKLATNQAGSGTGSATHTLTDTYRSPIGRLSRARYIAFQRIRVLLGPAVNTVCPCSFRLQINNKYLWIRFDSTQSAK